MHSASKKGMAAAAITGLAVVSFAGQPASAAPPGLHVIKTLAASYVGPLQFAVDGKRILVADSFTSTLNVVGRKAPIATGGNPQGGGDIGGVAVDPATHAYAFTTTNAESHTHTTLTIRTPGTKAVVADLSGYERTRNPDEVVTYGVVGSASKCARDALAKITGLPATYKGQVDSHPYAVAALGNGAWAVADAGGNDIVRVGQHGHVSTISVLPNAPLMITAELAKENGLPTCVTGVTYRFESVPTDVEVGPNGKLYVSTLSGSESDGRVYRVNPATGHATRLAKGLVGLTNLAIGPNGAIYIAELFKGLISRLSHGVAKPLFSSPGVVAVEYSRGHLYASIAPALAGGSGPGSVVELGH